MVDFDAAVGVGMAVRIPLAAPHDTAGFDRVLAVGVRSCDARCAGTGGVEALLAKHRVGDGCALAAPARPPTTPTPPQSGWQPPAGDAQDLFAIEDAPPDIAPGTGALGIADGWRLATLLGLSTDFAAACRMRRQPTSPKRSP